MSWDLDDILEAAAGTRRGTPRLIEVGRALSRGRTATTGYFWSTGRVSATVGVGWVRIDRRLGVTSDGLRIDIPTLRGLELACRDWARRRDEWSAFYYSCAGYPPGFGGGACYYEAPGKRGERIKIGDVGCLNRNKAGENLVGRDEIVKIAPRRQKGGSIVIAEIWRRGEHYGPKRGSLVGLRYGLGKKAYLDARRRDSEVRRQRGETVDLEAGEEAFVSALVDVVARSRAGFRGAV